MTHLPHKHLTSHKRAQQVTRGAGGGIPLTTDVVALFGTMTDGEVARRCHRTVNVVAGQRLRLGIPAYRPSRYPRWTARRIALLGSASDEDLAARWGCSKTSVRMKRISHGVPAFWTGRLHHAAVSPAILARLGQWSDKRIAREYGLSPSDIGAIRRGRGIPAVFRSPPIHWTPELIHDLGHLTLWAFCAKHPLSYRTVLLKRQALGLPGHRPRQEPVKWTKAMIAALGTASDERVAKQLGLGYGTVRIKRRSLGIELPA
ncbi:MAG: hypothetical protein H0W83_09680 [Planctomycetes bacterium]|nr:hypothetical protein [Planctomycetota bacterium]